MKNVLILHGVEGFAGKHWQQWLHDELVKRDCRVLMPSLPNAMKPDRYEWLGFVRKLVADVDFSKLTIVGHSLGVVTALDLIEKSNRKVERLFSVAGFGVNYNSELNDYFMKVRDIDFEKVKSLVGKAHVIYGDDDPYVPQKILKDLSVKLGAEAEVIKGGGHLNTDAGYTKFPLLLELLGK